MEARAKLKYVRLSPRKTRLVVDMVRGKRVQDALNILRFSPQKAAGVVSQLVSSAVANAEQKGVADVDRLYIKSIAVDQVAVFARGFEDLARQWLRDEDLVPRQYYDAETCLDELDLAAVDELARLAPFGAGNPQPVFLARGVHLQQMKVVGGSHLRFSACQGGYSLPGIAFGMAELQPHLCGPLDILFTPQRNEWRNRVSVQLQLRQVRPAAV